MLNTTNKVTDASRLIVVADASFVIGISLCEQWDTLKVLVETLIIADEVWIVSQDPGVRHGALVFAGTRVPVESLIQHLVD